MVGVLMRIGVMIETLWETIFSSSSREKPNRILPNLAHLLILCVFTSVLCGVNKEVKREKCPKFLIKSFHISEQYSKTLLNGMVKNICPTIKK
jgi:hypothetical protein